MSERIRLNPIPKTHLNPKTGRMIGRASHEVEFTISSIVHGGNEHKVLHKIKLGRREGSLIARTMEMDDFEIAYYIKLWHAFKDAGLPVLSMRQSGDEIFTKNLKHDGSEVFGKVYYSSYKKRSKDKLPLTEMEEKFITIMKTNFSKIKAGIDDILEKAETHHIILPDDDPFELLIHPNGDWEFVILDLIQGRIELDMDGQEINNLNYDSTGFRLNMLVDLYNRLTGKPPLVSLDVSNSQTFKP